MKEVSEDLRNWFSKTHPKGDWVRIGLDGEIKGPCAREEGEGKPKCLNRSRAESMTKAERAKAARRKRREDPVANREDKGGKPINVKTEEYLIEKNVPTNPKLWSQAKSLAKKKFDVYPSAYANGWAAKWYKKRGGGWKTLKEERQITMESTTNSQLDISQSGHIVEKNDEYSMARNQLRTAMTAIKRLMKHVEGEGELKAWVQSKLTKAADYMDSVADYMDSNDKVVKEARELSSDIYTILEAKKPKRSSSPDKPQRGVPGGRRGVEEYRNMEKSVKAAAAASAKQPKQPLPKKPSSKPPRVSAKKQSLINLSKVLSSNQDSHERSRIRPLFPVKPDNEGDNEKRRQRVNMVASHVIEALKHHSAHYIHGLLLLHSGNDAILHGDPRHPMHTPTVEQARIMMHDKLKEEGLHKIAKQYAPKGILRRIGQKLGFSEGYSVGEMGTDELVNRYKAMTPGQEKDKKTIETIKRVVESRRREFSGGYVGPGSTPVIEPSGLGSKPLGPSGLGRKRRRVLHGKRHRYFGLGRPRNPRTRRII